jgi:hypothetical protein
MRQKRGGLYFPSPKGGIIPIDKVLTAIREKKMKTKRTAFWIFSFLFLAATAHAEVGVGLDIHLGNRPAPPPPPVVAPPPIVIEAAPEMVYEDNLGVYVAVGTPYDLFFFNNHYFDFVDGVWFRSAYFRGPWVKVVRGVPPGLRRHRIEELREIRRHAWEGYRTHEGRHRERHFLAREARERHERGRERGSFKGGNGEERHR